MSRLNKILLLLLVLGGCAWLQYLIDDGLGILWPQNVLRNWQEIGLFNLHGRLVINPGGFEATTNPVVYTGMSPVYLYPVYIVAQLFSWTGQGVLFFHILLAAGVFWAVWELLGRDHFAFLVAAAAVLCPGYARHQKVLDPNVVTVLFGLPYIAIVVSILKNPRLGFLSIVGLFGLTIVFTSLNWTSVWVMGPFSLLLLGLPQINRRAAVLFMAIAGASSLLFAIALVAAKASLTHTSSGSGNLMLFLQNYTWGDVGYGAGLTTVKAFVRLGFVNAVALLPLFLLAAWTVKNHFCGDRRSWFAISPFAMTVAEIGFMRNYFGHHPWMSAPVLLVGIIFSVVLLRSHKENHATDSGWNGKPFLLPLALLFCFFYGLTVLMFFRANRANERLLINLVRHHTARSECLVIVKNLDPQTAQIAGRLDELLDRHMVVVDDLGHLPVENNHMSIISSVPVTNEVNLRAQTTGVVTTSPSWIIRAGSWFNHTIARRQPGDRIDFADTYFLYESKP